MSHRNLARATCTRMRDAAAWGQTTARPAARSDAVATAAPVTVVVDDPVAVAARCWDVGFTVRVHDGPDGALSLFVADPFGQVIALVGRTMTTARPSSIAASEEQR